MKHISHRDGKKRRKKGELIKGNIIVDAAGRQHEVPNLDQICLSYDWGGPRMLYMDFFITLDGTLRCFTSVPWYAPIEEAAIVAKAAVEFCKVKHNLSIKACRFGKRVGHKEHDQRPTDMVVRRAVKAVINKWTNQIGAWSSVLDEASQAMAVGQVMMS